MKYVALLFLLTSGCVYDPNCYQEESNDYCTPCHQKEVIENKTLISSSGYEGFEWVNNNHYLPRTHCIPCDKAKSKEERYTYFGKGSL